MSADDMSASLEAARLRRAAADADAWATFSSDEADALERREAAHAARVRADELDGFLPLGVDA